MKNKPLPVGWVLTHQPASYSPTAAQNSAESRPSLAGCASTRSGGGTGWG